MTNKVNKTDETTDWTLPTGRELAVFERDDRIMGVLVGQAAGDALGAPYEFATPPKRGHATMGRATFGFAFGEATDDTQQAVLVARAKSDPAKVAEGLLAWYRSGPRDIGGQTHAVLGRCDRPADLPYFARAYGEWQSQQPKRTGWDPGLANGSLMRCGPTCLPFIGDRPKVAEVAREVSNLTHYDDFCGDSAVLWSEAIEAAVREGEAWTPDRIRDGLEFIPAERREFWAETVDQALNEDAGRKFQMNGSAVGCFRTALWAVSHCTDLEDGLQACVSVGGDADTTSAVAGALLGAIHGGMAVPRQWRKALHVTVLGKVVRIKSLERLALECAGPQSRTTGLTGGAS